MKYFYDTEFLEGKQDKRFLGIKYGETKPTIDLISIGIVSEDDREYYAVSKDFNLKEAWNRWDGEYHEQSWFEEYHGFSPRKKYWIRENVLKPIFDHMCMWDRDSDKHSYFTYKNFRYLLSKYGKSNKQIAQDVIGFVNPDLIFPVFSYNNSELKEGGRLYEHFEKHNVDSDGEYYFAKPEFYGYYSAYDHVVLCWLFGKMIDLPKGFPMFTIDLKQMMDDRVKVFCKDEIKSTSFDSALKRLKERHKDYPKQTNEHHALSDAIWNKKLYHFLNSL